MDKMNLEKINEAERFFDSKSYQEAAKLCSDIINSEPTNHFAYYLLGQCLLKSYLVDDAISVFNTAASIDKYNTNYINVLGNCYYQKKEFKLAEDQYEKSLDLNPKQAEIYNNLGLTKYNQDQISNAIKLFKKAIELDNNPSYHTNIGIAYNHEGKFIDAINHYKIALDNNPDNAVYHYNIAISYHQQKKYSEAKEHYTRAIEINPNLPGANNNLGNLFQEINELDLAKYCFEKELEINDKAENALNSLIITKQHMCDWGNLDQLIEKRASIIRSNTSTHITPFSLILSPTESPELQLESAQKWIRNVKSGFPECHTHTQNSEKINIGYMTSDLHDHATAYLIAELFELHDYSKFNVIVYSYSSDDGSEIRKRICRSKATIKEILSLSNEEAANLISNDDIDILIDLKGFTKDSRHKILAYHPARIQISWLGYPGTMGADYIDYIIGDNFIIRDGDQKYYTEKVLNLPDCYQINDRKRKISSHKISRADYTLPEDCMVLCCFNHNYKITENIFKVWMDILKECPNTVLWLLESNQWAKENLIQFTKTYEIAPERIIFSPKAPLPDHLARYKLADLALDTFPVTSHTTASDALWAGCPLVTYAGRSFVSRVAGSLLKNIGLDELITSSIESYKDKVASLIKDKSKLTSLRATLKNNILTHPLFDSEKFTRNLENAYLSILTQVNTESGEEIITKISNLIQVGNAEKAIMLCDEALSTTYDMAIVKLKGDALLLSKKYDLCETHFSNALKKIPNDPELWTGYGDCLAKQYKYSDAINAYTRALKSSKDIYKIQIKLGDALYSHGQLAEAKQHYATGATIEPDNPEPYIKVAHIDLDQGDVKSAEEMAKYYLTLKKDDPNALYFLGGCYLLQGNLHKALSVFLQCKKQLPDSPLPSVAISKTYYRMKAYEKAWDELKPWVNTTSPSIDAITLFSRLAPKLGKEKTALDICNSVIPDTTVDIDTLKEYYYEAGVLNDKYENYDKAFEYFDHMNKLTQSHYDPRFQEMLIKRIIQVHETTKEHACNHQENNTIQPIFIIGMPRSGTSLIEQIISQGNIVLPLGESKIVENLLKKSISLSAHHNTYPECLLDVNGSSAITLSNSYYDLLKAQTEDLSKYSHVTDKMPFNYLDLGLISLILPNAKIIHCTRNPIDTSLSIYFQNFLDSMTFATRFEDIAHYYSCYVKLMNYWKKNLSTQIIEVSYESLIGDPENNIKRIIKYCGLEWSNQYMNFHRSDRHIPTASFDQINKPLYSQSVDRWKNYKSHIKPLIELLVKYHLIGYQSS